MGMLTSPKLIDPLQIERAIPSLTFTAHASARLLATGAPGHAVHSNACARSGSPSGPRGRQRRVGFVSLWLRFRSGEGLPRHPAVLAW